VLLGTFVLSSDYHDAYYAKAQRVRQLIRRETKKLLNEVDILLMPTCPTTAFPLGSEASPVTMYLADIFSVQANVAGVPALSIPYGKDDHGLPIGLQAMADDFNEGTLLQLARALQVDR
jgi:aspartyl-tRNA(Asn)/glutamyl-tRNA(Gln) amidotransferase subunit A